MSYVAINRVKARTFDAIVVGTGISGGWAAKELTGKGLRTLVLERGRDVRHVTDYPTTLLRPWELEHRDQVPQQTLQDYRIASKNYAFREDTAHFFTKDAEQPYVQKKPYDWIRTYQVGGRSLIWGAADAAQERLQFRRPRPRRVCRRLAHPVCRPSTQNPSLTYLALTARAADYAVRQLSAHKL